jgi:hypothetical protein
MLMTCFAVASCTEEMPMPDYSKDHIVLNIFNTQMTKADGDEETAYERKLNRLDCFFYVRGKTTEPCVYYQKVELEEDGQATVAFYVNEAVLKEIIPSGQICDVFVIANHPDAPSFASKQQGTDIPTLGQKVLDMSENEYDGVGKPFVMTGSGVAVKGKNSTATADISLQRVASKVTMTVKVPKTLIVSEGVTMSPAVKDDKGDVVVKSSFRHGTSKSYLYGNDFPEVEESHIITEKVNYTLVSETADEYVLKCSVPFYSYSRSWAKGSDHSAYITLQMPWGIDEDGDKVAEKNIHTYYYQILVNSTGRCFERNCWYDMSVNVSILGSTVESVPKELEQLSYYVLDWTSETSNGEIGSGDRDEKVEIQKFNHKDQSGVGRNGIARTVGSISQTGRNEKTVFGTDFHQLQCFSPAGDHLIDGKFDRFAAGDGTVKNFTIGQLTFVMDFHRVTQARFITGSLDQNLILQTAFGGDHALLFTVFFKELLLGFQHFGTALVLLLFNFLDQLLQTAHLSGVFLFAQLEFSAVEQFSHSIAQQRQIHLFDRELLDAHGEIHCHGITETIIICFQFDSHNLSLFYGWVILTILKNRPATAKSQPERMLFCR